MGAYMKHFLLSTFLWFGITIDCITGVFWVSFLLDVDMSYDDDAHEGTGLLG